MTEAKKSSNPPKQSEKKTKKRVDKKCSHLYFQERNLKEVPKLSASQDVNVIYLFTNDITKIDNLGGNAFPNLTSLYLQNNRISKLENLNLRNLRKLYIGYNCISVVEGLENLLSLEELHLEKQNLPDGIALCFDPRTIHSLSKTLQILNISHNKIPSFSNLLSFTEMICIDASNCGLDDLEEVCGTIKNWHYLSRANFQGNLFDKNHRYRENIIVSCYYLESLDGKEVADTTRAFLKRFEKEKRLRSKHTVPAVPNLADVVEGLPNNYAPAVQKAVSTSILKGKKYNPLNISTISETEENNHIAWSSLPQRRPMARQSKTKAINTVDHSVIINKFP
ncbi:protein phosphatase 1 regulatory subunit 42-like [Diabrotica virgifera virgifera]|uniref:Protein phosphatase 1 regulatory subunit 42-like n=1 Tax=Diabrotica virgifera virgifera TaxID=50390 RepID=A0ABM5KHQ0_DIAVI|nr:protein phosphatase 1 regulatory subunit 42-like [Diabrotica virgifera virgifera]